MGRNVGGSAGFQNGIGHIAEFGGGLADLGQHAGTLLVDVLWGDAHDAAYGAYGETGYRQAQNDKVFVGQ